MHTLNEGKYGCEVIGWLVLIENENFKLTAVQFPQLIHA